MFVFVWVCGGMDRQGVVPSLFVNHPFERGNNYWMEPDGIGVDAMDRWMQESTFHFVPRVDALSH